MSCEIINAELAKMEQKQKELTENTKISRFFVVIPFIGSFVPSKSYNKLCELVEITAEIKAVKSLIKRANLNDARFVAKVFELMDAEEEAVNRMYEHTSSDLGRHFSGLGIGITDGMDFGDDPNCKYYVNFALRAFAETLTEEQKTALQCFRPARGF